MGSFLRPRPQPELLQSEEGQPFSSGVPALGRPLPLPCPSEAIMVPIRQQGGWPRGYLKEEATSPRAFASLTLSPTSGEPRAEAVIEGRDQGKAGASRGARVYLSLCPPPPQLAARGVRLPQAEPCAGVLTTRPSLAPPPPPGPKSLFSEPGAAWAVGIHSPGAPGWVVGRDGGPAGPSRLPPDAAFPCGDLRGCLRIYFHFVIISL